MTYSCDDGFIPEIVTDSLELYEFEEAEYIIHSHPIVMENAGKMIYCGDPSYGGAMYDRPHCGKLKLVPFRCHSKFCPACSNKYCIERSTKMSFKLIDYTHRHLVFTIDELFVLSF